MLWRGPERLSQQRRSLTGNFRDRQSDDLTDFGYYALPTQKTPMDSPAYAVYAEHSYSKKPVQAGWNPRVFNNTEIHGGTHIWCEPDEVIVLSPGLYHITASSQVTYNDGKNTAGWNCEQRPNGGYCRLRYKDDAECRNDAAISVGTISNANMVPSVIDTYLNVTEDARIVLEHQVGDRVEGVYLQDNSADSTWHVFARIAIYRVGPPATPNNRPALGHALCAAYAQFLATPGEYQKLVESYLGVRPLFVPRCNDTAWPTPGGWLERVLEAGVITFGYADNAPYVFTDAAGLRGFEWEIGNKLAEIIGRHYAADYPKGLRTEWKEFFTPVAGDPEAARFSTLYAALCRSEFEVALSGQANISATAEPPEGARDVRWMPPTALLFTNILYTGLGDYDLSDLVEGTREQFLDRVKTWDAVTIWYVENPGPSPGNAQKLVAEINAAGGRASLEMTDTAGMKAAIAAKSMHFSVGDSVASAWIANQKGFEGTNLNIPAVANAFQTAQAAAPFTWRF